MEKYIGTKEIKATEMNREDYNQLRGWKVPSNENPLDAGYLVEYPNQEPNVEGYEGYVSWSPKQVFERTYKQLDSMTFGLAIEAMKNGHRVARRGWNGKNMFIVYMSPLYLPPYNTADTFRKVNDRTSKWIGEDTPLDSQGYFAMFTANQKWQPGWLASQNDMLADDWEVLK
ncbi:MAG: DUF2829 domain-containing protein [Sphaerochaetaceae bacterium]|nr:DUF2829 domain-containing protein [Sphaerochaetaceae bacterium]